MDLSVVLGAKHVYIKAFLRRVDDNASILLSAIVIAAFAVSIANQSTRFLRVLAPVVTPPPSAVIASAQSPIDTQLPLIFGMEKPIEIGPPPATNLQLTLLGSFVRQDSKKSSALIQHPGQPEQRYIVGEDIGDGAVLNAVYADHIELIRNGNRESLTFPGKEITQK